jgi:upstream activation factor subunit UAF30
MATPKPKTPAKSPAKAPAKKANAAFMKPVQPDDKLAVIVGSKPIPRTEVTKKVWEYIKKHNLQNPKKKTEIVADEALKVIFGGKKSVTMFEMTKLISGHLS